MTAEPPLPPSTARMPDLIQVIRSGNRIRILVDGTEFPFATVDGVQLQVNRDTVPAITVTIPAGSVMVVNALDES